MIAQQRRRGLWLFRLALVALPKAQRRAHGAAMLEVCASRLAERGARSALAWWWELLLECGDVLYSGLRWRLNGRRLGLQTGRWRERPARDTHRFTAKPQKERRPMTYRNRVESLLGDLRFSVRSLARRPGFVAIVMVTLVLGIGATTAIFTVVEAVLLRPLPYAEPESLVRVWPASSQRPDSGLGFSIPDYEDWQSRTEALSSIGLYSQLPGDLVATTADPPEELSTAYVTASFFTTLGVAPMLGRALTRDDELHAPYAVVLSERAWRTRFGADPEIVGEHVVLSDRPFEVVGVMPPSFAFPAADVELWTPLATIRPQEIPLGERPVRILLAVGRLARGVSREEARAELVQIASSLGLEYPDTNRDIDAAKLTGLRESLVGDVRTALSVLLSAVGLLLLIACANVANLMLTRGDARARELAIRRALGASGRRLTRLVLAESLLLSVVSGLLGLAAASWTTSAAAALLARVDGAVLPRAEELHPDLAVVAFAFGLSLLTGLLFGCWPAIAARRGRTLAALRASGATAATSSGSTSGRALVAVEVALATLLLVGAGLMVRSLERLRGVDPGFRTERTLGLSLIIAPSRYDERSAYLGFYQQLLERLRELPGVRSVATMKNLPLRGIGELQNWSLPDASPSPGAPKRAGIQPVSPGLFGTLGVPLLAGRDLTDHETAPVVVINRRLAKEAFDASPEDAVGRRLVVPGKAEVEVVGVVGDMRSQGLGEPSPNAIYAPLQLMPRRVASYVVETEGDPILLMQAVRECVRELDPAQALTEITTFEQLLDFDTARPRFFTQLLACFSMLAALLAAVGVYGVVSVTVGRRVPELGLRKALGATHADLAALVVRDALSPVGVGAVVGLVVALFATRLMHTVLFGVLAFDAPTYAVVAAGMLLTGLLASLGPARRAARSAATVALRAE